MVEKQGTPIIEFMKGLCWVRDGKRIPMYSKEDIAICEQFAYIGKLLDGFAKFYREVCKYPGGEDILRDIEAELKEYIEEGKSKENSFVVPWFHGKLDPSFYYNERNNELLREKVLERVQQRESEGKKPSLDKKIAGYTSILQKQEEKKETRNTRDLKIERQ